MASTPPSGWHGARRSRPRRARSVRRCRYAPTDAPPPRRAAARRTHGTHGTPPRSRRPAQARSRYGHARPQCARRGATKRAPPRVEASETRLRAVADATEWSRGGSTAAAGARARHHDDETLSPRRRHHGYGATRGGLMVMRASADPRGKPSRSCAHYYTHYHPRSSPLPSQSYSRASSSPGIDVDDERLARRITTAIRSRASTDAARS